MSDQRKKPIIILGMHRSGTSCLAGTLQQAGLCLGDVSTNNKFNIKGNRENPNIMHLSNSLLKYNAANWDKPPHKINWQDSHLNSADELICQFKNNCTSKNWGFKDPRILITYPFWEQVFPQATLIGTIRNPIDVAHSLKRRDDQFSINRGFKLWLDYNKILLDLLKKQAFPLISFDYPSKVYEEKITELLSSLFPNAPKTNVDFFDNSLRTTPNTSIKVPSEIKHCYTELKTFLS